MPTEELAFDLVSTDKGASDGIEKVGRTSAEAALKIDQANIRVEKSARSAAAAVEKFGKGSLEARDAAVKHAAAQQNLQKQMAGTERAAEGATTEVKGLGDAIQAAGVLAAGAAIGAAINKSLNIEAGIDKLQGQLGATVKDAERFGKIAGDVYSGAYGESLDQVNDAIVNVRQNIGDLGDEGSSSMQSITEDTLSLAQAFGVDLFEVTKAAGTLLRTGLAPDAQYALDLITVGLQKVPGAAEDLLDTFTEYSVQFQALGLTGDQALSFIQSAMLGGARNTDIAADALKEFNLRARDTTNIDAQSAISELGLSSEKTARAIAGGGSSAVSAMTELLSRLREIPDPADRSRLATALLGTQAEDLQAALFAVDPAEFTKGLQGVAGAADELNATLGDNGASKIESYRRQLELMVANAAGADGPLGTAAAGAAAFGGAALAGAASVAQLGAGIALIPGAATKGTAALTALRAAATRLGPALAVAATVAATRALGDYVGQAVVADPPTQKLAASLRELGEGGELGSSGLDLMAHGVLPGLRTSSSDTGDALETFGERAAIALDQGWGARIDRFRDFGIKQGEFREQTEKLDNAFALLVSDGNLDAAATSFNAFTQAGVDAGVPLSVLEAKFPKYAAAVKEAAGGTLDAASASKAMAGGLSDQEAAAVAATKSQDELNKSLSEYASQILGLRGDQRAFEEAIDAASASVKANGKTLDITTEKGRANQAALDDIAASGLKLAEQTPKGANAQKHFATTLATTRKRLEDAAYAMTGSRSKARALTSAILGVPSSRRITIRSNAASEEARIRALASRIRGIPDGQYTVTQILRSVGNQDAAMARRNPARAAGGPVSAGVAYIVGEKGQELFVPKVSGTILPEVPAPGVPVHNRMRDRAERERVRRDPGNFRPNVVPVQIMISGDRAGAALMAILRESIRVKGGNVQTVLGRN